MPKYLIMLTLCILAASLSKADTINDEMMKVFMHVAEACRTEVGASQSDIDDLIAHKPAAGSAGKCLHACVIQQIGVMDANGNLVKETALEHCKKLLGDDPANLKIAVRIVEDCAGKVVPGDNFESAENYKICLKAAAKANGVEYSMNPARHST